MKILAISHLFPHEQEPRYGIFVARQLEAMAEIGAEITLFVPSVYCPKFLSKFKRWEGYGNNSRLLNHGKIDCRRVFYIRIPGNWYNRWSGFAAHLSMRRIVAKLHEVENFDVIYANDFFPDGDIAMRLSALLGIPAVGVGVGIDVNQTAGSSEILARHFKRIANSLSGIIARGEGVADKIQTITGQKSLCVYGVVDLDDYCPVEDKDKVRSEIGLPKGCVYLLYAGYLDRRKGLYELIDAFAKLEGIDQELKLILCGEGSERENLKEYAVSKKIDNALIMPGMLEPEVMHKWMQASDLFVLPSYSEGMPNVIMEAMACGVPVVATAVGGIPKATENCKGVLLVPPRNVEALAQAIGTMLASSPMDIQAMSKSVRARAKECFGVKENAKKIMNFLREIKDGVR